MIYGVDVSAYQPNFDFAAARRDGIDFAIIKATEGVGWKSAYYRDQLARARAQGMLVAAYHYVNGSDVQGQLANIRSMVSTDTPVILDVEHGAGSIQSIRELNAALNRAGYRTPLIYIPRWYWQGTMGSPDLTGLPPNWHSRYPDNVVRRKEGFTLGAEYWPSFGGLRTEIAQFTSSLAVANYPSGRIDGNAYRGTLAELTALFNGDDDMAGEGPLILKLVEDLYAYIVSGGEYTRQANTSDTLPEGVDPSGLYALTLDTNKALRGVYDSTGKNIGQVLTELYARKAADVDEAELAAELAKQGVHGISDKDLTKIKAAFGDVLSRTRLDVEQP